MALQRYYSWVPLVHTPLKQVSFIPTAATHHLLLTISISDASAACAHTNTLGGYDLPDDSDTQIPTTSHGQLPIHGVHKRLVHVQNSLRSASISGHLTVRRKTFRSGSCGGALRKGTCSHMWRK